MKRALYASLAVLLFSPCCVSDSMMAADSPAVDAAGRRQRNARRAVKFAEVEPGKEYTYKQSGGEPQTLEIYFPANHDPAKRKVPGVILFHGGGWSGGNLSQFRDACKYFASRGLVAATANYRMLAKAEGAKLPAGESRKRVCVTDAKSAIRWMKQHADQLGIDPERIITGGGSAGGHIAVLATTTPGLDDPADPREFDTSVVAYVLFNPAFQAEDAADPAIDAMQHVTAGIAPAIVFFGTNDPWLEGWDTLCAKIKSLGNTTTEVWFAEGEAHSFFNRQPWQNLTIAAADRFLVALKLLSGECTLPAPTGGEKLVKKTE